MAPAVVLSPKLSSADSQVIRDPLDPHASDSVKSAARRRIRSVLSWAIAVLTVAYGVGDYFGAWDLLFGRASAAAGVARMGSARGLGDTLLCSPDPEFEATLGFILKHSENPEIAKLAADRKVPDCMTSIGGGEQAVPLPADWPQSARLVGHSPVVVMYNAERVPEGGYRGKGGGKASAHWAGRLDDISGWITQSREDERFLITTILLGLLSVALVVFDGGE